MSITLHHAPQTAESNERYTLHNHNAVDSLRQYELPESYTLQQSASGPLAIYNKQLQRCVLACEYGRPVIITPIGVINLYETEL